MKFSDNEILLFQGDSITDGGRGRSESGLPEDPNHIIGHSFPYIVSAKLALKYIDKNPQFYSRGISGNNLLQMYARWREDAINLSPTIINILIGINDCGGWVSHKCGSSPEQYKKIYEMLIEDTLKELKNVRLVLCEPFYFDIDGSDISKKRFEDIAVRRSIVEQISKEYKCTFVKLQDILESSAKKLGDKKKILWDGVHPTLLGHSIIAEHWLKTTEL